MSSIQNGYNYRYLNINTNTNTKNIDEKSIDQEKNTNNVNKQNQKALVGTGSWSTKQIKDAGLELPSKYFICVYTAYYRFNPDTISRDFPNKSIQSLTDLKTAIEEAKFHVIDNNQDIIDTKNTQDEKIYLELKTIDYNRRSFDPPEALKKVLKDTCDKGYKTFSS